MPRYPFQSRPTPLDGTKEDMSLLATYSDHPSLAYTGVYPPPPSPIFLAGPFLQWLFCPLINPQLCPFLEGPIAKSPEYHRILPSLPHQKPLPAGLPSYRSLSPMPSLATPRPFLSWEPPPHTHTPNSFLGPSHTRIVSPSHHPLPGSGLVRGPREAGARWGPQWGGRAASMAAVTVVRRQPPVPGRRAPASL